MSGDRGVTVPQRGLPMCHGTEPALTCPCWQRSAAVTGVILLSRSPAPGSTTPLHIESPSSAVAEGQTLDLNCIVARQGQATITWYKRGGSLPAKHQVGDTR